MAFSAVPPFVIPVWLSSFSKVGKPCSHSLKLVTRKYGCRLVVWIVKLPCIHYGQKHLYLVGILSIVQMLPTWQDESGADFHIESSNLLSVHQIFDKLLIKIVLVICGTCLTTRVNWQNFVLQLGFGVFTSQAIMAGEFVLEYTGRLMSVAEADEMEDQTYVYYFVCASLEYRQVRLLASVGKFDINVSSRSCTRVCARVYNYCCW